MSPPFLLICFPSSGRKHDLIENTFLIFSCLLACLNIVSNIARFSDGLRLIEVNSLQVHIFKEAGSSFYCSVSRD